MQCPECQRLFDELRQLELAWNQAADAVTANWKITAREFLVLRMRANETLAKRERARQTLDDHRLNCVRTRVSHVREAGSRP